MTVLPHTLERTVTIHAQPETVFKFFTDSERWAKWWGAGSTIDARPGGRLFIRHPGGVESAGEVIEVTPPGRIVFTYGFTSGNPIPEGASRVTITLKPDRAGTILNLQHAFAEDASAARDEHVQGWRFQLSLFANVVSAEVNADAATTVDSWFDAWSEPDTSRREEILNRICATGIRMQDRFSNLEGMDDLKPHLEAAHHFMPGMRLDRTGEVRHCQGMLLADWNAHGAGDKPAGSGTNVFVCGPTGLIEKVTGFWNG